MNFKSIIRLIVRILHQGGAKLAELIFCGKRDVRAVLVLHKYCLYLCSFVEICFIWHSCGDGYLIFPQKRYRPCPGLQHHEEGMGALRQRHRTESDAGLRFLRREKVLLAQSFNG